MTKAEALAVISRSIDIASCLVTQGSDWYNLNHTALGVLTTEPVPAEMQDAVLHHPTCSTCGWAVRPTDEYRTPVCHNPASFYVNHTVALDNYCPQHPAAGRTLPTRLTASTQPKVLHPEALA